MKKIYSFQLDLYAFTTDYLNDFHSNESAVRAFFI